MTEEPASQRPATGRKAVSHQLLAFSQIGEGDGDEDEGPLFVPSQTLDVHVLDQKSHLFNGGLVKFLQAILLRYALLDQFGIETFEIGKAHELRSVRFVADIPFGAGVRITPLTGSHPKERDVQHVGLVGVNMTRLRFAKCRRD
jgi:hypothetical protein